MRKRAEVGKEQLGTLQERIKSQQGGVREMARIQAILMYEKKLDFGSIEELCGLGRSAVLKWRARFLEKGIESLVPKEAKAKTVLTKAQIAALLDLLKNTKPSEIGYGALFWTTSVLAEYIKREYNVEYKTKKPLYLLFKKAKFTYHKPGQQYRNRDQQKIDQWIATTTPIVQQHLAAENTVVLTGDEMVLSTQTTFQKIWLPVGSFPKVDVSNKRENRSIYGFLNVKTGKVHAFKTEWQNSEMTCKVLDKLCAQYADKHIVILWDNAPWHRSKEMREWLAKKKYNLTLIAFPPYAPELNPQEHVWKAGRSNVSHNKFIENIDSATDAFVDYLQQTTFNYDLLGLVHV